MADEYIRRQDAIDKINERQRKLIYCFGFENDAVKIMDIAKSIVIAIPSVQLELESADVVPVVRCRNCENWQTDWNPSIPDRHYCAVMDSMMKADDFCSYGERREE